VPFLLIVWPFLIPIGAAFYMFYLAWTRGGDPEEDSATVQYEPPENLSPAECGALLDNQVLPRGITATIVDLSVKGYLAIEPGDGSKEPGPNANQDYVFHLIKQPSEWNTLKRHEHAVLGAIFIPTNPLRMLADAMSRIQKGAENSARGATFAGMQVLTIDKLQKMQEMWKTDPRMRALMEAKEEARPVVTLSQSQNVFYLHKTILGECVFDELIAGGYYASRPDRMRQFYAGAGILMGILLALVGRFLADPATPWSTWIMSAILTALIIAGFGFLMPARSVAGARALGKVRGFVDFLGRVEKDHIERLEKTPELFEKYLPYAMALGVENKWAQAFGRITVQPKWHRGPGGEFFPMELVEGLSGMPNQTGHTMTPTDGAT
jgi:Predicted membrane protein (DUF2207) C-terminal domain